MVRFMVMPMMIKIFLLTVAWCGFAFAQEVKPLTAELAKEYDLDPAFYTKTTFTNGILIATSDKVSDFAHLEAAYLFDRMMSVIKPEIAQRIREGKVLCLLVGHNELTSEMPQFKTDKKGKELAFYNWRSRGFLTLLKGRPTVFFAEEDVMEYEGGMQRESILIHEFGHVIHRPGFYEGLDDELMQAWKAAKAKGLWNDARAAQRFRRVKSETPVSLLAALQKSFPEQPVELLRKCLDGGDILVNGKAVKADVQVSSKDDVLIVFGGSKRCYAAVNRGEYFAEMVQAWFGTNRTMDHDHNHIHTREQLKQYDKQGYAFLEKIFINDPWMFVSPRERAGQGHLEGYDPVKAPKVVEEDFLKEAANDYYDKYWSSYWNRLRIKHGMKPVDEPKDK